MAVGIYHQPSPHDLKPTAAWFYLRPGRHSFRPIGTDPRPTDIDATPTAPLGGSREERTALVKVRTNHAKLLTVRHGENRGLNVEQVLLSHPLALNPARRL